MRATLAGLPPDDTPTLLLGRIPLTADTALDAAVIRPHSITLLTLQPQGGQLRIPAFGHGAWLLEGLPLSAAGADNPFIAFRQQRDTFLRLLEPLLPAESVNAQFVTGLLVPMAPLTFGPDVEASMAAEPGSAQFQLLPQLGRLPRRLAQLATPAIDLTAADILELANQLAARWPAAPDVAAVPAAAPEVGAGTLGGSVQLAARQLWRWLGAEDVDDLPADTYELASRGEDRKHELEELQANLQHQVDAQLRALEAREAERERSIAQLRTELAQAQSAAAPQVAELQVRLRAETQAKEQVEQNIRQSQHDWQQRNQELDGKIQALERLIQQLQPVAGAPAAAESVAPPAAAAPSVAAPTPPRPAPSGASAAPAAASAPGLAATLGTISKKATSRVTHFARQLTLGQSAQTRGLWLASGIGLLLLLWVLSRFLTSVPTPYQENGRWGFAEDGKPIIEARYASVQPFEQGRAVVERDGAFGLIDEQGQEVVAPAYDALNPYHEGFARVRIGDVYTFIDEDGTEFDAYFYNAYDFAEGFAPVLDRRGWFYLSGAGPLPKRPRIFQEAYPFHNGLARVRVQGSYTFIDPEYLSDSTATTEPFGRYESATDFADGRATVRQNGRTFTIDRRARPVQD
ncbi:WG repeat-containing protein [Hymenobacter busanensis]|nr:WG repeat-containing protein [Hymenobacter busanensis]